MGPLFDAHYQPAHVTFIAGTITVRVARKSRQIGGFSHCSDTSLLEPAAAFMIAFAAVSIESLTGSIQSRA
ncbi:hypothetical protein BLA15945_00992 [Burkholderia lata]|uniref:Uncharacterized protein n=1 Tax=Burkholderia lata (strain ATCC 17760 / DSM 23089 / LMG 22485 / NCIMB 9086 / R18194 / 383) TaxID=482957 RepID=A0A6P2I3H1_BURL3|nr:hypothetical protein BLA15945_00992 [Burkholderia lata]